MVKRIVVKPKVYIIQISYWKDGQLYIDRTEAYDERSAIIKCKEALNDAKVYHPEGHVIFVKENPHPTYA